MWANAGIASFGPMALTDPVAWERTIEVNVLGAYRTVRAALPAIIANHGYVAVTASLASFAQAPGMSAYAASKAGVEAMCNALRLELAPHGVAVGTIHPTWIDTDMVRETDAENAAYRRLRAALTTRPFERDLVAAAPEIERLFAELAAEHGRLEASVSERTLARLP